MGKKIVLEGILCEKALLVVNDVLIKELFPVVREVFKEAYDDEVRKKGIIVLKGKLLKVARYYGADVLEEFIGKYAGNIKTCFANFKNVKKRYPRDENFSKVGMEDIKKYFDDDFYMNYEQRKDD
jgi:ATP-dependent protease HslVU (ClpYQ) peptidase subunit